MGQSRTRIKICGLTREQDIKHAISLGVDAIGFVFYPKSGRYVTLQRAAELRQHVPAFVSAVALFVNATKSDVEEVIERVQPNILQFHGNETPAECRQYGLPYIKTFRVGGPKTSDSSQLLELALTFNDASAWLFDTFSSSAYGGLGEGFDYSLLRNVISSKESKAIVLAGGLNSDNVTQAIRRVRPFAVDVSSGVEQSVGLKCEKRMLSFAQSVSAAHQ